VACNYYVSRWHYENRLKFIYKKIKGG
jgi:hypothetical protein